MKYNVLMISDEYGGEEFGPYDTLKEAYEAVSRISLEAAKLNDEVLREFHVKESAQ